jgi:hypothetical protein
VLSSAASGQLQTQHEYKRQQLQENTRTQQTVFQLRLFAFKHEFQKISIDLQTALAAETRLAEG